MANDNLCVFCGQRIGTFRGTSVQCGGVSQPACRSCALELEPLNDTERCRRALARGLAAEPDRLRFRLQAIEEAEDHRPTCTACGGKLRFRPEQRLDNSPYRDGLLSSTFDVLPACCYGCGRYEFYDPKIARKNPFLAYLIEKDSTSF